MATIHKRSWTTRGGEQRQAWQVFFTDQHGKRRHRQFARKKGADAFMVSARAQVQAGTFTADSESVTVAEAAKLWLERGEIEELERSTMKGYRARVRYHIEPLIGAEKLSRLTKPRVEVFVDEMLASRSRALTQKCLTSLKGIISEAERRGLVAQNVARDVKVRTNRRHKEPVVIPTKAEVRAMLEATPARWRPLLVTAVFSGLRASELRGLTWADVDFKAKVIRVRQRADEWCELGSPKSAAGRREIPMTPFLAHALKEWKLACPNGELDLVFPNGKGRVENLANIHNRFLMPLQRELGITDGFQTDRNGKVKLDQQGNPVRVPKYGLHSMRHFFASWLIDQGFGSKRVQTLMGHSSIQLTFDRYGHLFPNAEDDQAKLAVGELSVIG